MGYDHGMTIRPTRDERSRQSFVQGMRRYYGLMLGPDGKAQLVKALDGTHLLAEKEIGWRLRSTYDLKLRVAGNHIQGWVNDEKLFDFESCMGPKKQCV